MSTDDVSTHPYAETFADVCRCGEPPCSPVHVQEGPFLVRLGPGGPHIPEPASPLPWRVRWDGSEARWAGAEPIDPWGMWIIEDADGAMVAAMGDQEDSKRDAEAIVRAVNYASDGRSA